MLKDIYQTFLRSTGVSIDTRTMKEGNLFVALAGSQTDGSKFVDQAIAKGASGVIYNKNSNLPKKPDHLQLDFHAVEDPLKTLQDLGTHHRRNMKATVISLTGSNGKTTTKELLHLCLERKFETISTTGNFNNHIGVPLTLLSIEERHEVAVIEMGANHQKEIEFLCELAEPTYGFITNFGKAHLEGFGGVEGVIKGKSEMYRYLDKTGGKIFVADWDDKQKELTKNSARIIIGENAEIKDDSTTLSFSLDQLRFDTQMTGGYNFHNAVFAAGVAMHFGVSPKDCKRAIESYIPENNRSQVIRSENGRIILDAYNANPSSMEKALINLAHQPEKFKVAILGDMLEMGEYSEAEHKNIAYLAETIAIDKIYLIGKEFHSIPVNRAEKFKDFEEFKNSFDVKILTGAVLLIKGSRGGRLERVIDLLKNERKD
jgi:UDP-N-acetylmuramoyl-tripeptide--D-alanyl-D-alanine ligase